MGRGPPGGGLEPGDGSGTLTVAGREAVRGRPTVDTAAGTLAGARGAGGLEFLGVPYVRAERFAPPAPADRWSGVRDASRFGFAAPQPDRPAARFTHGPMPAQSEQECLNLNVFTPSLEGERPVMVWLHGGGFAIGHAGASLYHGGRLAAAADAIVVTVNYRLGSLGWLCHPSVGGGNWGLLDQIAALSWVRTNIAAFGGDPGRVTLAGQSAGALCAIDLLAAPAARGLFRRVVLQSPPLGDLVVAPDLARRWAQALADPAELRTLPAESIVARHEKLLERPEWRGTRGGALPTLDPASLPTSALEAPGVSAEVEVLAGHTAHEGTFFFDAPWRPAPPPERIPAIVAHLCPAEDPDEVLRRHRGDLVAIATEAMVAGPLAAWCGARARAGSRVWRYRFDHPGAGPRLRATHTAEVPLLFGTWRDGGAGERLGGQATGAGRVANALVKAWGSFLHGNGPAWPPLGGSRNPPQLGVFGGRRPHRVEPPAEALTQA
jgi:para-nitrobenzyl esterase